MNSVPCVAVNLSIGKERELNIRLNRNNGEWDWDKLANEFDLSELIDWGFDAKDLGVFEEPTLEDLSDTMGSSFEVVVECFDEGEQQSVYERLTAMDMKCRILTL